MIKSAGRRQKKKSRRTADTFPRAYGAAALGKIRAAVPFCFFRPMLMQSGGQYLGGYCHVNFRYS